MSQIESVGEPRPLSKDELEAIDASASLSSVLPWGGKYPPGVVIKGRDGFDAITADGQRKADLHQSILSFSLGGHATEVDEAKVRHSLEFPGATLVDTTRHFEPATLLRNDLHQALKPHGDYLIHLTTTGTGANEQAIRLAMGSLGGPKNCKLIVLANNYGGAGLYMNSVCEAAGWRGDTSLESNAEVVALDGSNLDEVFARCAQEGKKPILIMEDGVQGVGGFNVLDEKLLRELAVRVHDAGGRKIYDNVQTFVRSSGEGLFGFERWADTKDPRHIPDFVTLAKGLGDGHPIAALAVLRSVAEACKASPRGPGNTFDTFNQYRDSLAVARKVLQISQRDKLGENMVMRGAEFGTNLNAMVERFAGLVSSVVGTGGMTGLTFRSPPYLQKAMERAPQSDFLAAKGGSPQNPVMRLPLQFDTPPEFVARASQCVEDMLVHVQEETGA